MYNIKNKKFYILVKLFIKFFSLLILLHNEQVCSEPFDFYCSGPRTRSVGCSGIALSEGYEAVFLNPALISAKKEFGIGYIFASQKINISYRGEKVIGDPLEDASLLNPGISLALSDLPFISNSEISDNIFLGLSAMFPLGEILVIETKSTKRPSAILYGNRNDRLSIYAGLSGKIRIDNFKIYLGGAANFLAIAYAYINLNLSPDQDLVDVLVPVKAKEGFSGGVAFELEEEKFFVRAGGSFRTQNRFDLPAEVRVNFVSEELIYVSAQIAEYYTPSFIGVGIGGGLKLAPIKISSEFNIIHYRFSEFRLTLIDVLEVSPKEIKNLLPKYKLPAFQDINAIRGGILLDFYDAIGKTDIIGGLGAGLFPSPLKSQNGSLFVDSERLILSGGLGSRFASPFVFDGEIEFILSGGFQILSKRDFPESQIKLDGTVPFFSFTFNVLY